MKKPLLIILIALGILAGSSILLFIVYSIASLCGGIGLFTVSSFSLYNISEMLLMCLTLAATSLLSYLVYKVNYKLTELSAREQSSRIKESAYQIYYCLTYNIESLINQINDNNTEIKTSFKMGQDYINHIANLSKRLPDELIRELYEILFELSFISSSKPQSLKKAQQWLERIISTPFTIQNYRERYKASLSVIIKEVWEIINT